MRVLKWIGGIIAAIILLGALAPDDIDKLAKLNGVSRAEQIEISRKQREQFARDQRDWNLNGSQSYPVTCSVRTTISRQGSDRIVERSGSCR